MIKYAWDMPDGRRFLSQPQSEIVILATVESGAKPAQLQQLGGAYHQ
jgi:hypothetical protein